MFSSTNTGRWASERGRTLATSPSRRRFLYFHRETRQRQIGGPLGNGLPKDNEGEGSQCPTSAGALDATLTAGVDSQRAALGAMATGSVPLPSRSGQLMEIFWALAHRQLVEAVAHFDTGTAAATCGADRSTRGSDPLHDQTSVIDSGVTDCQHARRAIAVLHAQGFDIQCLGRLPIGLLTSLAPIRHELLRAGFSVSEIRASKLLADCRLPGRLIGPIRDPHGRIVSFWARSVDDSHARDLFLDGQWKTSTAVVGLEIALAANVDCHMVLVEDVLDALLLQAAGMGNVAAIGGSAREMTARRWQRLAELGVARVTLALRSSQGRRVALHAALAAAYRAKAAPDVWFLPPDLLGGLGGQQSLASIAQVKGPAGVASLLQADSRHAYHHWAETILAHYRTSGEWLPTPLREALDEAIEFYVAARPGERQRLDRYFVPPIVTALGLEFSAVEDDAAAAEAEEVTADETTFVQRTPPRNVPRTMRRSVRWCTLHECDETDCFCFD